jgi:hypothetical protein
LQLKVAFENLVATNKDELLSFAVPFIEFYKLHIRKDFKEAKVIALEFVKNSQPL